MPDALAALTDEAMQPEAGFEGIDIERHTVHALALAQAGRAEDAVEELESTLAAPSANGAGTGAAAATLALAYCAVGRTDDAQERLDAPRRSPTSTGCSSRWRPDSRRLAWVKWRRQTLRSTAASISSTRPSHGSIER